VVPNAIGRVPVLVWPPTPAQGLTLPPVPSCPPAPLPLLLLPPPVLPPPLLLPTLLLPTLLPLPPVLPPPLLLLPPLLLPPLLLPPLLLPPLLLPTLLLPTLLLPTLLLLPPPLLPPLQAASIRTMLNVLIRDVNDDRCITETSPTGVASALANTMARRPRRRFPNTGTRVTTVGSPI